jgi:hypothetical protein
MSSQKKAGMNRMGIPPHQEIALRELEDRDPAPLIRRILQDLNRLGRAKMVEGGEDRPEPRQARRDIRGIYRVLPELDHLSTFLARSRERGQVGKEVGENQVDVAAVLHANALHKGARRAGAARTEVHDLACTAPPKGRLQPRQEGPVDVEGHGKERHQVRQGFPACRRHPLHVVQFEEVEASHVSILAHLSPGHLLLHATSVPSRKSANASPPNPGPLWARPRKLLRVAGDEARGGGAFRR